MGPLYDSLWRMGEEEEGVEEGGRGRGEEVEEEEEEEEGEEEE